MPRACGNSADELVFRTVRNVATDIVLRQSFFSLFENTMHIDYGLAGRTALVTGAANGIGLAIAAAFARQGCHTIMVDRDANQLAEARKTLDLLGMSTAVCDLSSDDAVRTLAASVTKLDILINNAGVEYPTPLDGTAAMPAHFARLLDNNVTSMARLTNALLAVMPDGSCVINQSSTWGLIGVPGFSAYVASKHAVIGLTRSMAWELGQRNIRVNAVCPGWVFTEAAVRSLHAMAASSGTEVAIQRARILAQQAIGKEVAPEDIASTFLFLASDGARAITGQALAVNYGEVMS